MVKIEPQPHPVILDDIIFTEFNFKRYTNGKKPFSFPKFEISGNSSIFAEDRTLVVELNVKSESKSKVNALSFKFIAIAVFKCDYDDAEDVLKQFSSQTAHYSTIWPHVRSFIFRIVQELGLPGFNIPLVLSWKVGESDGSFIISHVGNIQDDSNK